MFVVWFDLSTIAILLRSHHNLFWILTFESRAIFEFQRKCNGKSLNEIDIQKAFNSKQKWLKSQRQRRCTQHKHSNHSSTTLSEYYELNGLHGCMRNVLLSKRTIHQAVWHTVAYIKSKCLVFCISSSLTTILHSCFELLTDWSIWNYFRYFPHGNVMLYVQYMLVAVINSSGYLVCCKCAAIVIRVGLQMRQFNDEPLIQTRVYDGPKRMTNKHAHTERERWTLWLYVNGSTSILYFEFIQKKSRWQTKS